MNRPTRALSFADDVARAVDVDRRISQSRWRLGDDSRDVQNEIAIVRGAFQPGRVGDIRGPRLDIRLPLPGVFIGVSADEPDGVAIRDQPVERPGPNYTCSACYKNSHGVVKGRTGATHQLSAISYQPSATAD